MAAIESRTISVEEAVALLGREEAHFWDFKSKDSTGKVIQKIGCALANSDGGEFLIGVEDAKRASGLDRWVGFATIEDGNHVLQSLGTDAKPPVPYTVEWLRIDGSPERGFACLATIRKSADVHETSDGTTWVRRSAQTVKVDSVERTNLALSKGATSYESQELHDYKATELAAEAELRRFLSGLSPKTSPDDFIRKQRLVNADTGNARLAGAILFADFPPAVSSKRCSVKVARYETTVEVPDRKHLAGVPLTIEGPAYQLIDGSINAVQEMIESVTVLKPSGEMEVLTYPPDALKEVIVNAVIHRDYNISDDIVIRVFDNRVEVRSPGRLPGHMTLENLLTDRFSRNPTINRLINKYPDPPNKDIGEGLKTTMRSMAEAKLKAPTFTQDENSFTVVIGHTPLARPEEIVLEYLASHDEITNAIARRLTGIDSENAMKSVFYRLRDSETLEQVPGKKGNKAAWRLKENSNQPVLPLDAAPAVVDPTPIVRRQQRWQPRRQTRAARRKR